MPLLETDLLLDRRRLKRRLSSGGCVAVLAVVAALLAAFGGWAASARGRHVARLTVSGIITEDRKLDEAVRGAGDDRQRAGADRRDRQPRRQRGRRRGLHDAIARVAARSRSSR